LKWNIAHINQLVRIMKLLGIAAKVHRLRTPRSCH